MISPDEPCFTVLLNTIFHQNHRQQYEYVFGIIFDIFRTIDYMGS